MKMMWGGGIARPSLLPRSDGDLKGAAKAKKNLERKPRGL
jgi:hypothetical protein